MNSAKKWSIGFLLLSILLMTVVGGITAYIDPFFHYHKPLERFQYPISRERYQNDGIVKHFDYDTIITGTSMTENFRVSEVNELFDVNAIKVPFNGSTYKEVDNNLRRAIKANPKLKMVIRCLDGYMLYRDKDRMRSDITFPEYLYDSFLPNDVEYLLNKTIFLEDTLYVLQYTNKGKQTTSFDDYANWNDFYEFGPESVFKSSDWFLDIKNNTDMQPEISDELACITRENLEQNVIAVVKENPQIDFYFYFPPYSVVWWGDLYRTGTLRSQVDCYRIASEMLLQCENVRLFSFSDDYSITTDLNHYKDLEHHSELINSRILGQIHAGNFELTENNYYDHWESVFDYYNSIDYESLAGNYQYLKK